MIQIVLPQKQPSNKELVMKLFNFCLGAAFISAFLFLLLVFVVPESAFTAIGLTSFTTIAWLKFAPLALTAFFFLLGLYPSYTKKEYARLIGLIIGTGVVGIAAEALLVATGVLLIWKFGLLKVWVACVVITITIGLLTARTHSAKHVHPGIST
ncbi:MAG: hypothetical protein NTV81_01440 [Candidatus Komeilibacteria bacterium]|nr:hypothetical protein [Candidatus Komeilibacteria bacterium]